MQIKNARVFKETGEFVEQVINIAGGRFTDESASGEVLDASGLYAVPGLVDIHFHGCVGYDFCDGTPEAVQKIAAYELSEGITTIVPATMSFSEDILTGIMKNAADFAASQASSSAQYARLMGINMEGPFISIEKKGAQNAAYIIPPDTGMFRRLQDVSGGLIKLCDIAPETDGALDFIRELKDEVAISLAHTTADYDTAAEAFSEGAAHVTHLFNAMPPMNHRAPGVVGAAMDACASRDDVHVELICDGIHIHPAMVRAAFRMFGDDNICLISDSMMATGLADGEYSLGGQSVHVVGNRAQLCDGTIAGSATNLMNCVRTAVRKMGIPLGSAVKCASVNPAKAVGIFEEVGSIAPGKHADLLLIDDELNIHAIIKDGIPAI